MNSVANENEFSGQNAQKMPPGTVTRTSAGAETAAQEGQTPIGLEVSWDVASVQNVAIVDVSGNAGDPALPPVASLRACCANRPGPGRINSNIYE